jgi:carbonic anhydrase/acetyltransferase-like protein (isoleucine patch superfamily)
MRKFVIEDRLLLLPFNEPASELTVLMNGEKPAPLGVHLSEVMESVIGPSALEITLGKIDDLEEELSRPRYGLRADDEVVVYRDNLFFDKEFFSYFLDEARRRQVPCQAALPSDDDAWGTYSIPLSSLVAEHDSEGSYYPLDIYYFPAGWAPRGNWQSVRVPSGSAEKGYYGIPDSMTNQKLELDLGGESHKRKGQDLTYYLSKRSCVPIQSWVHLFNANVPLGIFSRGFRFEDALAHHNLLALKVLWRAVAEQKQVVSCSEIVKVGRESDIDPSAIILGPTTIGDNVTIGAGTVIDNCVIGDNVNIAQGCNLVLSMVGNGCFLPFRASLFMTTLMDNTIVAQNTCLQMCVVGRNSFVGAGSTFTDFNLLPSPLKAINAYGELGEVGQPVIGGAVGHNVRIGSGMIVMPARMIESDVILVASPERRVISKSITYDMSDHLTYPRQIAALHRRLYPRRVTMDENQMLEEW